MKGEQSNRGGVLQVSLPFRQSTRSCGKPEEVLKSLLKKSCCQGHNVKLDRKSHKSLRAVFFPSPLQTWETILHCLCCGLLLDSYCKLGVGNELIEHV